MAATLMSFTVKGLDALPLAEKGKRYRVYDKKLPAFGLCVTDKSKSFHVKATIGGMTKRPAIQRGKFPNMHPDQARRFARELLADIANNGDPIKARRESAEQAKAAEVTYREVLESFLQANKHKHKESTQTNYRRYAKSPDDFGSYLDRPLANITFDVVLDVNTRRGEQSIQSMKTLKTIFNFAIATYRLNDKPVFTSNPVSRLWTLKLNNKYTKRRTLLKADQFPEWFAALSELDDPRDREYMLFLLFTGCRGGEVSTKLTWDKIDFSNHTYTLDDTKNRTDFMAPLPEYIETMISKRKEKSGKVFPQVTKDGQTILNALDNLTGFRVTRHDLRRTFTTCAAANDIQHIVLQQLLNHTIDVSSGVTDDYKQLNEMAGFRLDQKDPVRAASEQIEVALLRVLKQYKNNIVTIIK